MIKNHVNILYNLHVLHRNMEAVVAYFTLSADLDERDAFAKDVLNLVNVYFKDQNDLTVSLNDNCNKIATSLNVSERIDAENIISDGIYTFRELSLSNTKIKKNKSYILLISKLDENNTKIKTDMTEFNAQAQSYNTIISRFPYSLAAKINNLSQISLFKDISVPQVSVVVSPAKTK